MNDLALAIVLHLVADWLFQNEWMALNKVSPKHPAGYVHAAIHGLAMLLVFSWPVALGIAVVHWFIDLRFLLAWWRKTFRQTTDGPMAIHVAIWEDQVAHIAVLALAVTL